jgi:hypothetical protein
MKRKTDDPEKPKKRRTVRCVIGRPGGLPDRTPWWPATKARPVGSVEAQRFPHDAGR